MRAAWYSRNGEADDVFQVGDLPTPEPDAHQVRIKLKVSGVNPSDVKARRGRPIESGLIVPHSDGAGVIDKVGEGVSPDRLGERVWVWNGQWRRAMGTAAEYIVLPQDQAVRLPDTTDFQVGACLGIPALTAVHAVELAGDISGKTVLVIGAASSVGYYVAQLALMKGARVIGTVGSAEKAAVLQGIGVAETINYKKEAVADRIRQMTDARGVDIVIDMDLSTTQRLVQEGAIAAHGTIVCYGSNRMDEVSISFRDWLYQSITLRFFLAYELLADERRFAVERINELLAQGRLIHRIGPSFALDDIAKAHQAVEAGSNGNVIVVLP
jgi:NADPH2:quinone reductase